MAKELTVQIFRIQQGHEKGSGFFSPMSLGLMQLQSLISLHSQVAEARKRCLVLLTGNCASYGNEQFGDGPETSRKRRIGSWAVSPQPNKWLGDEHLDEALMGCTELGRVYARQDHVCEAEELILGIFQRIKETRGNDHYDYTCGCGRLM
ncbi:predicted protein [Histoplasma capsulatum var. duboisii H88]|uniref:Predicted protein n=1 Tax=Ajellomyces capsulatus (strain H88) TaxID=544711 RepID=F0UDW5_AJEC8|nr:predicted protein [Histoplasma capsulatum var. duboisii H88]